MRSLTLYLGPVYSRLADDSDLQGLDLMKLPEQWRHQLRRHQAQTWQAFSNSDADVIFDTALTGDGKSLAGQLPMLADDRFALLLYPTNELIRDQVKQVERYLADFGIKRSHQVVYSERITEEVEKYDGALSRSSALLGWLKNRDYILSNPDLFHLMSSYNYGSDQAKREFAYQIPSNYQYLLFDEFHIFGPPQVVSVVNIMNYHKVAFPNSSLKYVFLSATPSRNFRTLLEKSGFQLMVVEGSYSPIPADGYTAEPIVQPVALHLHSLTDGGAYAWAEEHLAEVIDFYRANEGAKGVFIVNSVATAKRLVTYYRRELQEKGILRVGENTRLTDPKERLNAMENPDVQLIIATSTIDVGVDFKINLLIFESTGSGTFIQRLGRLGRHSGWNEYRAYALLPDWTVDRFASHFIDKVEVDRVKFLAKVRELEEFTIVKDGEVTIKPIFQPDQEYRNYTVCWGGLQTAHIVISTEKIGNQWKGEFVQQLRQQYNKVYSSSNKTKDWIGSQMGRYRGIANDELDSKILLELNTFRGRSPLDCGIFDVTDGCFKTYNLFFLLANTVFKPISEAQFKKMLTERGQQFERFCSRDLKLYVILEQYIDEREQFSLSCSYSFKGKLNQVHVYDTFTIRDSRTLANHLDESVNDTLRELELICLVAQGNPKEFKRQNGLNPLFPVYQVKGMDGMERSIVFGLDAFLAHSLVFWKAYKSEDEGDEIYIC